MNEGWELLPTLDEKVELRWIMGGKDEASDMCVIVTFLLRLGADCAFFFQCGWPRECSYNCMAP